MELCLHMQFSGQPWASDNLDFSGNIFTSRNETGILHVLAHILNYACCSLSKRATLKNFQENAP